VVFASTWAWFTLHMLCWMCQQRYGCLRSHCLCSCQAWMLLPSLSTPPLPPRMDTYQCCACPAASPVAAVRCVLQVGEMLDARYEVFAFFAPDPPTHPHISSLNYAVYAPLLHLWLLYDAHCRLARCLMHATRCLLSLRQTPHHHHHH
jgi:hypothetical protein